MKRYYYTNGKENKFIHEGETPPEGWWRGQTRRSFTEEEKLEIKKKKEQTLIEHYGSLENAQKERMKKQKETNKTLYGVENVFQSEEIKTKIKDAIINKYGVDNISKDEEIKKKKIETHIEHFGIKSCFSIPDKMKEVISLSHSESAEEKRAKTNMEKYGVENVLSAKEIRDKCRKTLIEKYGVENAFQRPGIIRNYAQDSIPNIEFATILTNYNIDFSREFNLGGKRFDFNIDNLFVEINPTITHNSTFSVFEEFGKAKSYHSEKSEIAKNSGYFCIHIFDWDDKEKIISELILKKQRVFARNCVIREINKKDCDDFLNSHHLQGTCNGQEVKIGLFYNDELISLMTFGKPRYNKNYQWELLRYCSSKNVVGGQEKLFKYFIRNYSPTSIISYCDNSKFSGEIYKKLNFNLIANTKYNKHWYNIKTKQHITDNLLRQRGFDQLFGTSFGKGTDNETLMLEAGFVEIYDCGQSTYVINF